MIRIYIALLCLSTLGISQVHSQGCNLSCHNLVNISLDSACQRTVVPADVATGDPTCYYLYTVELTYGSTNLGNTVDKNYIGKTLDFAIIDTATNNRCTGKVKIEDKYPPTTRVPDVTISCFDPYPNLSSLKDACGFNLTVTQRGYDLEYFPCGSTYEGLYMRYLRIADPWGNFRNDTQMVYLTRPNFSSLVCPTDKVLNCDLKVGSKYVLQDPTYVVFDNDGFAHPKPIVNKETKQSIGLVDPPAIRNSQGQLSYLWDTDGACHIAVDYKDFVIADCGLGYKIRREWTVYDWCTHEERTCTQWITIKDNYGPQLVKPKDITAATGTTDCKASVILPWPELKSACKGGKAAYAKTTYEILRVNDDHYHTTTKILQGDLTLEGAQVWVEPGHYEVWYVFEDKCKRVSKISFILDVVDLTPPVAKCKPSQQRTLDGCASRVYAKDLDAGSSDNCCSAIHVAIAQADSVVYYRNYWTDYLKSCLGNSLYKQKQSEYESLIEEWINLFIFADYVDIASCGNIKLELRAFPACGMTTKAQAGFPGTDHSWFCITAYPDYFCHYADHYLDVDHHDRPDIVCNKSAITKASINFCSATMSSIYSRLSKDGVDAKTIDKMKSWQWVSAQEPYAAGYGSCSSTWTFSSQANWSLQGAPDASIFSDGTPTKGVLETAGLRISLATQGNSEALDCSAGSGAVFNSNYGYNQFKAIADWGISGYPASIPVPSYCPSWLVLDYYDGRVADPNASFVDPQVTNGCSSIQLTAKTTNKTERSNTTYTRTWTGKDGCNKTHSVSQNVIVQVRSDFEVIFPPDTVVNSMEFIAGPLPIADDEDGQVVVDHSDEMIEEAGQRYMIRRWTVRDDRFSIGQAMAADIIVDDRVVAAPDRMVPRYLKDNGDGIVEYLQLIKLLSQDTTAPVITCASDTFTICVDPALCLSDTVLQLGSATDDQPGSLHYRYEVWNDSTLLASPSGATLDLPLLVGTYKVVFHATDGGGNSAKCEAFLKVSDCAGSAFKLKDSVTLQLDSSGVAILSTDSLILSAGSLCGTLNRLSFSPDSLFDIRYFACGDPDVQDLPVYVLDQEKGVDTFLVTVILANKAEICQPCGPLTPCPDSIPPMLICASQDYRICTNPDVCLSDTTFLLGLGMDETTSAEHLHFHYRILQNNAILAEREGHLFDLPLLAGQYVIELMVEDGAGNQTMCRSDLTIEDCCLTCSGLIVQCQDTVAVTMTENKQAMVLLDQVDGGSYDDCGGEIFRSFRRDTIMPYRVITCADSSLLHNGILPVTWYVGLAGEPLDSCITQLVVLDFGTYCQPAPGALETEMTMDYELMEYHHPLARGRSSVADVPAIQGNRDQTVGWQLKLIPNPAEVNVMAELTVQQTGMAAVQVLGLDGKQWITQDLQVGVGSNELQLNIEALPPGLYTVLVMGPEPKTLARLVKL